jgi:hypothetical protein
MEFPETIVLSLPTYCLIIATAIAGTIGLLLARFVLKDYQLARTLFFATLAIAALGLLYPLGQLLYAAPNVCRYYPETDFHLTWEMVASTLGFSAMLLIPGLPCGYLFASAIALPINLATRSIRGRRSGSRPHSSA